MISAHGKILHVCHLDKFIPPFINFVEDNFDNFAERHLIYLSGDGREFSLTHNNVITAGCSNISNYKYYLALIKNLHEADKIILHGLFNWRVLIILLFLPWVLKKCYWAIWGADLYSYQLGEKNTRWKAKEFFRRFIIKRLGHFITHIEGDYELAKKWYRAEGDWHECFMYPSNLYYTRSTQKTLHDVVNILVGNSADPSNNHIEAFEKIKRYAQNDIQIFCPLSYGDAEYAKSVAEHGKRLFGDKFHPIFEFLKLDEYQTFLGQINIAMFNHKRQQGMGNATTLLGLGAKVYMRVDVTPYAMFEKIGAKVFPMTKFDLSLIDSDTSNTNQNAIKEYFSKSNLKEQWAEIYG